MNKTVSYLKARELLLEIIKPIEKENVSLKECSNRILAQDIIAIENVPPFDRSPYDGYAFSSIDTINATKSHPITLKILEEIPAGGISHYDVKEGYAVKILTGAPIPNGADAVLKYEDTEFNEKTVTIFSPSKTGSNIIKAGEDVKIGDVLAEYGTKIDPGLAGTLAAQNISYPLVYKIPKIGIVSTGSELLDVGETLEPGKIYNSNQYMLSTLLQTMGCYPIILGNAVDNTEEISHLIKEGLKVCDALILTGGVSAGDYDLTPDAMKSAGVNLLFHGVDIKPGMACAYGEKDGKIVCGLSGNPASSLTNFYAIAYPAIRKLCGYKDYLPQEITVTLANEFKKKSRKTRLLRGTLELTDGIVKIRIPKEQGNVVLSSTIGCNVIAIIPAGSGSLPADTELKGFLI